MAVPARPLPDDVPREALDDAPDRGVRAAGGHERPAPLPDRERPDRHLGRLRHADADGLRLRRRALVRRGGAGGRRGRPRRRRARDLRRDRHRLDLGVDDDQPDGLDPARDVPRRRRRAWHPARAAVGHDAGGHREGVHRPEGVDLPRRALASHLSRHDHVRRPRASAVEPDQHLRLPRPRGRLHRRAGGRLHARRRDRLRGARDGDRHGLRRVRAALLVLLHRALRLPRGSGEVPGGTAAVGEDRARPLRRAQAGVDAPALPLPDLGLLADRSPAAQQRRPRSAPGARRCLRRRAVACT